MPGPNGSNPAIPNSTADTLGYPFVRYPADKSLARSLLPVVEFDDGVGGEPLAVVLALQNRSLVALFVVYFVHSTTVSRGSYNVTTP